METNTDYLGQKPVTDKRVINFMMRKLLFWTPVKYGKHTYYMTFENNIYRTKDRK